MSRKNVLLRRIAALMLAFVTLITSVSGVSYDNPNKVMAANMQTGSSVFQRSGLDVFGDGRHTFMTVKFAEGMNAYCVEYGADINNLSSYQPTGSTFDKFGPQQLRQIGYALAYGFAPLSPVLIAETDMAKYTMTQVMIWCITEKYWGNEAVMNGVRDRVAVAINREHPGVGIQFSKDYFNQLRNEMTLAINKIIPSMFGKQNSVPTITLHWNDSKNRYQETVADTNGVLGSFDLSGFISKGIGYERSGNIVTFYSTECINETTQTITINPATGSYAEKHCAASCVYWGNGTSDQAVVTVAEFRQDPIYAFVRFNTEKSDLNILKLSSDNDEPLDNVTFDIYADEACTRLIASTVTGSSGEADVAKLSGFATGMTYFIKERAGAGATNHRYLEDVIPVTLKSGTNTIKIYNDRVPVTITLSKTDEKTGEGVAGAVYSLYAREDIKAAAGSTVLYEGGEWVNDFPVTDDNGQAVLNDLYIGKYYVKEKSAPESGEYLLDTTEYEVNASANAKDFAADAVISLKADVTEKRSPGLIKIEKTDSETGVVLMGAEFGIYSDKECTKLLQTIVTDESGTAASEALNEGTYYVKELKAPEGYVSSATVYSETVTAAKTTVLKIENDPTTVTVTKTSVTGDCPEIPGAELVIKDSEGNEVHRWISTTEPHVIKALPVGSYTLTELRTPFGYQVAETVEFTVEDTGEIQPVTMTDAETYGQVIINKTDEATNQPLEGVKFEIRYAQDVTDATGEVVITAGTVADTLITDETGNARSKLLPIGTYGPEGWTSYIRYELVETEPLAGYVSDDTVYPVLFEYVDDKTPVITRVFEVVNEFEESEPETEPESEPESESETEPESEPESEPETEPESEPETEPESTKDTPVPVTGDYSTGALWILISLFSIVLLFILTNLKVKEC